MAIVVVGGHSRDVGKTSVVAGIIAALLEFNWTAMKITQYGHGVCSRDGKTCHCASDDHSWAMSKEQDSTGESDTSRFLVAGAVDVWWVRSEQGRLAEAMPTIRRRLGESQNVILESNSILRFIRPDMCITVLDPSTKDFKISAKEFLDRADAVVLHEHSNREKFDWEGISLKPVSRRPIFRIKPPAYVTPELVDFVRSRITRSVGVPEPI